MSAETGRLVLKTMLDLIGRADDGAVVRLLVDHEADLRALVAVADAPDWHPTRSGWYWVWLGREWRARYWSARDETWDGQPHHHLPRPLIGARLRSPEEDPR